MSKTRDEQIVKWMNKAMCWLAMQASDAAAFRAEGDALIADLRAAPPAAPTMRRDPDIDRILSEPGVLEKLYDDTPAPAPAQGEPCNTSPTSSRTCERGTKGCNVYHAPPQPSPAVGQEPTWSKPVPLHIDSWGRGQRRVHAYVDGDKIALAYTDGEQEWAGKIPLPTAHPAPAGRTEGE